VLLLISSARPICLFKDARLLAVAKADGDRLSRLRAISATQVKISSQLILPSTLTYNQARTEALYESIEKSPIDVHGSKTRGAFVAQSVGAWVGSRELVIRKASPALATTAFVTRVISRCSPVIASVSSTRESTIVSAGRAGWVSSFSTASAAS